MKEDCGVVHKSLDGNSCDPSAVNNVKYNNHDKAQFDSPVYVNFTAGKMINETSSSENEDNSYQYTSLNAHYDSNRSNERVYMKIVKAI